jgi:hypothetical protein
MTGLFCAKQFETNMGETAKRFSMIVSVEFVRTSSYMSTLLTALKVTRKAAQRLSGDSDLNSRFERQGTTSREEANLNRPVANLGGHFRNSGLSRYIGQHLPQFRDT